MLDALLRKLNSPEEEIRAAAIEEARTLPPEQLLQLARQASRLPAAQAAPNAFIGPAEGWKEYVRKTWKVFQFLIIGFMEWEPTGPPPPSRALYSLAQIVEETEEVRLLELAFLLLERSRYHADITLCVVPALKRLLPKVTAEQASLWTEDRKDMLLSFLLTPYRDLQMTLAVLQALEHIGDASIIPTVRELARKGIILKSKEEELPATSPIPVRSLAPFRFEGEEEGSPLSGVAPEKVRQVKQAAQKCLLYLDMRLSQAQQSRMLLRPSDASQASASETLLRPAAEGEAATATEHLLRPVEEPGGDA